MKTRIACILVFFLIVLVGFQSVSLAAEKTGYDLTASLRAKAVLKVPGSPVTLIWKPVGTDITPSGAQVVSGYFYADPNDFAYGSQYNPELFVKVYIDPGGWSNIAFNHVTVDDVDIYSAHGYNGSYGQTGTATLEGRLIEHQYNGVSIDSSLAASLSNSEISILSGSSDGGSMINSGLWAKAVLQPSTGPVNLIWKMIGSDTTITGDRVVSGYFYADPNDFAYGSEYNPEIFVKIYIAANGWANMAYNHVTVDEVNVYSAHNYIGSADQTGVVRLSGRLAEHQYNNVVQDENPPEYDKLPIFEIYTNPGDPLALTMETDDGNYVEYFAIKDEEGLVERFTSISVTNKSGEQTDIRLNDECQPDLLIADNGTAFHLEWREGGQMIVTAVSPEGGVEVSVPIDNTDVTAQEITRNTCCKGKAETTVKTNALFADKDSLTTITVNDTAMVNAEATEGGWTGSTQIAVNVTNCGESITDASVHVYVSGDQPKDMVFNSICYQKYSNSADSTYYTTIPVKDNRPETGRKLEPAIKKIAAALGLMCSVVTELKMTPAAFCPVIGASIDSALYGPTGESTVITKACISSWTALFAYCHTLGAGVPGGPTPADFLANNMASSIDRALGETLDYFAIVTAPGLGKIISERKTLAVWESMPTIDVDYNALKVYANFSGFDNPAYEDTYRMGVTIQCASPNTPYTITVVGSDGHSNSTSGVTQVDPGSPINYYNDSLLSPCDHPRKNDVWEVKINDKKELIKVVTLKDQKACTDSDGDNFYAQSGCGTPVDCRDNDREVFPGGLENCTDGKDNNCNAKTDCQDDQCKNDPICQTGGKSLTGIVSISGKYSTTFKAETLTAFLSDEGSPYVYGQSANGDEIYFVIVKNLDAPMSSINATGLASLVFSTPQILDGIDSAPIQFNAESGNIELSHFGLSIGSRIMGAFTDVKIVGVQYVCDDGSCSSYSLGILPGTMSVNFDVILDKTPIF